MIRHLATLILLVLLSLVAAVAFADSAAVVENPPTRFQNMTKDDKQVAVDEYKTVPVRYLLETAVRTPVLPAERVLIKQ